MLPPPCDVREIVVGSGKYTIRQDNIKRDEEMQKENKTLWSALALTNTNNNKVECILKF